MNTIMNCNPISTENNPFTVCISVDNEAIEHLENEFHEQVMALKSEEFGFGVWFTDSGNYGVYGDDEMRTAAIFNYCDNYAEQIEKAFEDAETLDEAIMAANTVILGTIIDILATPDESEAC